ncbi:T9SS type A sorting domain-containing protein [Flavobacterium sp. MC2016-06]|uniref:T9SS-dependent choice-of-anchor J family protein n=1 Tax=Flavobacterium sp. MC2016-06 TaxID=2676308 RepID=UPI0012BAD7E5|nr:T9SS type A sorting domain-containing protein [Flavobacterium sp. MC2016-06]MBU3861601.1 T9SS type A sorting domain-containing protein [Flavobacterium sp. MC2016-06]
MRNIYSFRHLMAFLSFFYCFSGNLFAQTMPNPIPVTDLPYTQNFSGLGASETIYPAGFQGWNTAGAPGSAYVTSGTLVADRALTANSSASTTSGNIHNYNGKIGFLNSASLDLAIGFAFETTGKAGIQVQYEAMVIRNPYDGANNIRYNEMSLQYRVGQTNAFTTLPQTAYLSTSTLQTASGVTIGQNPVTIKVTLPAECDNQPIVQIRWISKQNSGSGSRPSFAIDNIEIRPDIIAPVNTSGFPAITNILSNEFDFSSQIDEAGKTYYTVVASGSAEPTAAQVKAGLDANGTAALQSGFLDITNNSLAYSKTITGLSSNTAYIVYSVSEDVYGNIQTVVNKLDAVTSSIPVPSLVTTSATLDFGIVEQNTNSATLNYQIQGANISDVVTVTATANFSVSKDNVTFQSSVVYNAADFASNNTPTVYVRFTPNAAGTFSGTINHESTGATSKTVSLSGIGTNPYVQDFNDPNVLTNSGWTAYNVAGTINKWVPTTVARNVNSAPGAVLMNGYSDSGPSKDWLISPKLRLDTFDKFPVLSFYARKFYNGPSLKLMVSTDYDGVSSPETATWTELNGSFTSLTDIYVQSKNINLAAYKTNHTYLAWVYETTAGGTNYAAEWSFDDYAVTNEATFLNSNPNLDFGDVSPNAFSAGQAFTVAAGGYGDITVTAPSGFQVSLDNVSFQSSIVVAAADALVGKTVYARFAPTVRSISISGAITVTGTGLNQQVGSLKGSSLPKTETFDIVSYNLEFFGTAVKGTDGVEFGPTDNILQVKNVAAVMNKLDADVYVVQEVSDEPSLNDLITQISINGKTFDKSISTSWSYSFNAADPNFPPQKLVVIYNTQTVTVKKTRVMFKDLYDAVRANTTVLPGYPGTGTAQVNDDSFFASGRLPYMVDIEANINGVKRPITLIDLHGRANSGTDISKYNMRKYDAELLKDSLDVHYPNTNFMILGDYNDDVKASVIAGNPSSYQKMVEDTDRYNALTLGISQAGAYSFLSSGGFLDHITISNELTSEYIPNSIAVYDPRTDIANYVNTTSDHGPVIARFELNGNLSTIDFGNKKTFFAKAYPNPATDVVSIVVKSDSSRKLKLRIYDMTGKLVVVPFDIEATSDANTSAQIQISNLHSGIYVYTLSEDNKVVYKDKIIKK